MFVALTQLWRPRRLALAGAICAHTSFCAAEAMPEPVLEPVLVSASRFAERADTSPPGTLTIDAEQIRQSGAGNVNQAIRGIAGIVGRPNSYGTADYSLDLRGFGPTADQNMVVLLDGVRLSENELSVALLSSIPIETVQRIEIVRGGSSVLYGEGATAGTIQVITKRAQPDGGNRTSGSLVAEAGSFGQLGLRATLARTGQGWSLDAAAGRDESDNYRDNNRLRQENLSGGVQWAGDGRRFGVRLDSADQHYRTAGALTMAQYLANPRSSFTPDDYGATRVNRVVLFGEQRVGALELAAELSQRDKSYSSHSVSPAFGISDYATRSRTTQFSPRLRYLADLSEAGRAGKNGSPKIVNELVAGFDFSQSARHADSTSSLAAGGQRSRAVYARDEIRSGRARLAFGLRRESFDQRSNDPLAFNPDANYDRSQALTAWDLQASVMPLAQATLFAKAGRSYRVANVDENGFTLRPGQMLAPQTSDDLSIGATLGGARQALTATLFQHNLRNEIMYDPTVANPATGGNGANVNLDPTVRRGIELEWRGQLSTALALSANFQHIDAHFREGSNAGREVVLAPRNSAGARVNWQAGAHSARVGVQWVASQRYGSDFDNTCAARMPAYATLDARYAWRMNRWEFALNGANLTDRNYFSQAYSCQGGIYSAPGRQVALSARYDF
ncbi:TonB-dependent receptor [Oxalobacteraceae bacterium CAVE-383]|nr:TonB-dependent receptor [Oxalobacteraceae bacterium CAVE-383]